MGAVRVDRRAAVKLTPHAKERMTEMGVSADEVYACIREPEVVYRIGRYGPDRLTLGRGRIAVAIAQQGNKGRVITVLWRGQESRDGGPGPERQH